MQRSAYVTGLGVCLPNAPVANDEIEQVLGRLSRQSAAVKRRALINNGIISRHYAIDPVTGSVTHTNAEMTAEAVRAACKSASLSRADIACLVCGTSSADQLIPSHASMVHAALDCPPCEVIGTSGVCCSGVSAFFRCGRFSVMVATPASRVSDMASCRDSRDSLMGLRGTFRGA